MAGTVAADPELERFSRNKESVAEEEQVFTPPVLILRGGSAYLSPTLSQVADEMTVGSFVSIQGEAWWTTSPILWD